MSPTSQARHLRQAVAQLAARLMAEEGVLDYAYAKRKAARQLGVIEAQCLPANGEIEQELRLHHQIYRGEEQPRHLHRLRSEALTVMRLLQRFNPHLVGAVLDGTAGRYAETEIHLYADSLKDVEMFLLNGGVPYQAEEKTYRFGGERRRLPCFSLEGREGPVRLIVFTADDLRHPPRSGPREGAPHRAATPAVAALVAEAPG